MVIVFLVFSGFLLPCLGEFRQELMKMNLRKEDGVRCSYHSECASDCCLVNFDSGGTFCAPRSRKTMPCLPQVKGAINIICPCRAGLSCKSHDPYCLPRCHLI
ncbi:colipase-like protein 2 [Erinaceus europaeus]|uniref:Colipase-like protein 2 n=1 Tax=Erinaceus europaeus TaxID=9365 RepID=A0A1S3AFU7_ERIEU|nr:colipase-like protein 2 [Erinaceus europaeus]